jgi:hypothetical protein
MQAEADRLREVDVNGNTLPGSDTVHLFGKLKGAPSSSDILSILKYDQLLFVAITFDPESKLVTKVEARLAGDPGFARTEIEYDRTGLFDVAQMIVGGGCSSLSRVGLYQFFENQVKPKISRSEKQVEIDEVGARSHYFSHANGLSYCDHAFRMLFCRGMTPSSSLFKMCTE